MAKKSTTKSLVRDFKPKRVRSLNPRTKNIVEVDTKKAKVKVIPFDKAMQDSLLLGLLISGTKSREEAEKLAIKIREFHTKRMADYGQSQFQRGYKSGEDNIKDSLRSLIGAAPEDHSHSIS